MRRFATIAGVAPPAGRPLGLHPRLARGHSHSDPAARLPAARVQLTVVRRSPVRRFRACGRRARGMLTSMMVPPSLRARDRELAVQRAHPLAHAGDAVRQQVVLRAVGDADAVVLDQQRDRVLVDAEVDVDVLRPRVLHDVGQRFLQDPVERDRNAGRDRAVVGGRVDRALQARRGRRSRAPASRARPTGRGCRAASDAVPR